VIQEKACGTRRRQGKTHFGLKNCEGGELVSLIGCIASKVSDLDLATPDARHRRPLQILLRKSRSEVPKNNFGGCSAMQSDTHAYSRSHDAVIRVYDAAGNVIETQEYKGDFKQP
jgi:hypothetical protein